MYRADGVPSRRNTDTIPVSSILSLPKARQLMVVLNSLLSHSVMISALMISRELEQNEGMPLAAVISPTGIGSCAEAESRRRERIAKRTDFMSAIQLFSFLFFRRSSDRAEKRRRRSINSQKLIPTESESTSMQSKEN